MNRSRISPDVLSILGLIAALAIAAGLDTLATFVSNPAHPFFNPFVIVWTHVLAPLVLAGVLLLLFWFVLTRAPRIPWIGALYLLVGLYIAFAQVLYFAPVLTSWWPPFVYQVLSSGAYTVLSGSFIAITGLFMLILRRR